MLDTDQVEDQRELGCAARLQGQRWLSRELLLSQRRDVFDEEIPAKQKVKTNSFIPDSDTRSVLTPHSRVKDLPVLLVGRLRWHRGERRFHIRHVRTGARSCNTTKRIDISGGHGCRRVLSEPRHLPVSGGRSASSSSFTASGDASGMYGGRSGGSCDTLELKLEVAERSCVDVAVLVGVSAACSMSSCLTISSASIAWSGESEPEEAERRPRLSDLP